MSVLPFDPRLSRHFRRSDFESSGRGVQTHNKQSAVTSLPGQTKRRRLASQDGFVATKATHRVTLPLSRQFPNSSIRYAVWTRYFFSCDLGLSQHFCRSDLELSGERRKHTTNGRAVISLPGHTKRRRLGSQDGFVATKEKHRRYYCHV